MPYYHLIVENAYAIIIVDFDLTTTTDSAQGCCRAKVWQQRIGSFAEDEWYHLTPHQFQTTFAGVYFVL